MSSATNDENFGEALRDAARAGEIDEVADYVSKARERGDASLKELLDSRDEQSGNTSLHFSSANGHIDVVSLLLKSGACTDVRNASGSTALHYAALTGQLKVVEALLKGGASPIVENNFGRTALDDAQSARRTEVVEFLISFVESNSNLQDIEGDESKKSN